MSRKILFSFLFVFVIACPLTGQVKKQLTEVDYKLWSTMETKQLSEKGSWVSYSVHYESSDDTLFVKNTRTLRTFAFPGVADGSFASDNYFLTKEVNKGLVLTNLNSGFEKHYPNVTNYAIALSGKTLILQQSNGSNTNDLLVVGLDGTVLRKLPQVSVYSLNPDKTKLVFASERKLHLLDLHNLKSATELDGNERSYNRFAWQCNGSSFAWLANDELATVGQYRIKDKIQYTFDRTMLSNFPTSGESFNLNDTELSISDDGEKVFFAVTENKLATHPEGVQVWNTVDKILYAARAAFGDSSDLPKLAVWFPEKEKFGMVTNNQYPHHIMIPGQHYALVYNSLENEPQFDSDAPINYYLQNISTGRQQLLLEKHSPDIDKIGYSNTGKYISYFKDNQWWVYDIQSNLHRNLTSNTDGNFINEKYDRSGEKKVCGIAGWTDNDEEVIVYDNYDLWLLKANGCSSVRLTKGLEQKIIYRVVSKSPYGAIGSVANGILNINAGILLQAVSEQKSGYFSWSLKRGLHQIVFENYRIGWLKHLDNETYIYTREHYHLPPQLVFKFKDYKSVVIYQSNLQQKNYEWGFSKLISYENSSGKLLNGALFYPAGYNADKSYPMIVHIYERQSDAYNQYVNPTLFNTDGFNVSNFTTRGYFVLLPDIMYIEGQTGGSAVDCVVSAVDEVLAHESVDPKQLGLCGHSFGGYETNFIITQTDKFAAAISGAGISDIVSSYLTVGRSNKKSDGWRYEFGQFRIGVSLFDDYQKYLQNSPITFARQINTPLLIWCGEGDTAINYSQSLELHLALRRLQKPNIFLLYERGGHAIMQKEDQSNLTQKIQEWFAFYLKGEKKPKWFMRDRL